MKSSPLADLDILVVEDHYFVAAELARMLEGLGAAVIGPIGRLPPANYFANQAIDIALLDVKIGGETSLTLADEMARRNIPVALITGYGPSDLPHPYGGLLCLDKPFDRDEVTSAVLRLTGRLEGVPG